MQVEKLSNSTETLQIGCTYLYITEYCKNLIITICWVWSRNNKCCTHRLQTSNDNIRKHQSTGGDNECAKKRKIFLDWNFSDVRTRTVTGSDRNITTSSQPGTTSADHKTVHHPYWYRITNIYAHDIATLTFEFELVRRLDEQDLFNFRRHDSIGTVQTWLANEKRGDKTTAAAAATTTDWLLLPLPSVTVFERRYAQ